MKTSYPFIRHIPIVVAMSISHVSDCAKICDICKERETVGYQHRAAPGVAMTDNGDNDTPVPSQSERDSVSSAKPSQAMRAADRDPAGGEIPVELAATRRLMTSSANRGVEDKLACF